MHVNPAIPAQSRCRSFAGALLLALAALPFIAAGGDEPGVPPQPQVEATRLDGSRYSLNDSRGSIAVVVVWTPDSLPSRKSLGELQRFAAAQPPGEVSVMAISTMTDAARLRDFATERRLDLPLAILETSNLGPFPEPALPRIHVFNRDGSLQASHSGLFRLQTLEAMIAPLLRSAP